MIDVKSSGGTGSERQLPENIGLYRQKFHFKMGSKSNVHYNKPHRYVTSRYFNSMKVEERCRDSNLNRLTGNLYILTLVLYS